MFFSVFYNGLVQAHFDRIFFCNLSSLSKEFGYIFIESTLEFRIYSPKFTKYSIKVRNYIKYNYHKQFWGKHD